MRFQTSLMLSGLGLMIALSGGCGGGGSSTPTLSAKTRTVKPGDQWVYSITGKSTTPGSTPVTLTGTLTLTLSAATEQVGGGMPLLLNGQQVLELKSALTATSSDQQTTNSVSSTFLTQDATTGDISEVGDDVGAGNQNTGSTSNIVTLGRRAGLFGGSRASGGSVGSPSIIRMVTPPQVIIPGTWSNNLSKSAVLQFNNGDSQTYALNVTGTEIVQTPSGRFSAWIANSGADSGVTTDWAPQLGAPVRLEVQIGSADTGSLTETALLKSTNVAH